MTAPDITIYGWRTLAVWGPGPHWVLLLVRDDPEEGCRWLVCELGPRGLYGAPGQRYATLAAALDAGDRLRATLDIVTGCE